MKKTYMLGATVAAGLMALALSAQAAPPTTAAFPRLASQYTAWFARAMDPCDPAFYTVSVTSPHMPAYGCLPQNEITDALLTLKWARLAVSQRGKLMVIGIGLPPGARVGVQLDLRFTVAGVKAKQYSGTKTVTFEDRGVICPNPVSMPYGFTVGHSGFLAGSASLADCLSPASALQNPPSNIEILGAQLINLDNGKAFGEAGVVR